MSKKNTVQKHPFFERFASWISKATGSSAAFAIAVVIVLVWAATGPFFNYSEVWQLVINTGTTIITFLMVFLIQKAQNKDSMAIQLKLNELVASHNIASNRLICVEDMTEEELKTLQKFYSKLAALTQQEENLHEARSIDEAQQFHQQKKQWKAKK